MLSLQRAGYAKAAESMGMCIRENELDGITLRPNGKEQHGANRETASTGTPRHSSSPSTAPLDLTITSHEVSEKLTSPTRQQSSHSPSGHQSCPTTADNRNEKDSPIKSSPFVPGNQQEHVPQNPDLQDSRVEDLVMTPTAATDIKEEDTPKPKSQVADLGYLYSVGLKPRLFADN